MTVNECRDRDSGLLGTAQGVHDGLACTSGEVLRVRTKAVLCLAAVIRRVGVDQVIQASLLVELCRVRIGVVLLTNGRRQFAVRHIGILRVLLSDVVEYRHRPSPSGSFALRSTFPPLGIETGEDPPPSPENLSNSFFAFGSMT